MRDKCDDLLKWKQEVDKYTYIQLLKNIYSAVFYNVGMEYRQNLLTKSLSIQCQSDIIFFSVLRRILFV